MNESGYFDDKGFWHPPKPSTFSPLFDRPFNLKNALTYIFGWGGYLWPKNAFYVGLAALTWFFLLPADVAAFQFNARWIGLIFLRNIALMWGVFGFYQLFLYTFKAQGTKRKYNQKWLEKNNKRFLFNNQLIDNIFMSSVSGGIIWTAYELLYLWAVSNQAVPLITISGSPLWFIVFMLLIPAYRESHFYFVHRLIHWKPLLRAVHSIHHKNPNPGPWSGLSMHPVEHILYFSDVLIHFIVPSHPIHFFFNLLHTALTPAQGHIGFEGPFFKGVLPAGDYFHYLHHQFVDCNFGTTTVPWDRWLGKFYNGEGPYRRTKAVSESS
jgi:sterol desaturase/sphingolipid hydroxylase (fatty acid hydroxylase superfamily)